MFHRFLLILSCVNFLLLLLIFPELRSIEYPSKTFSIMFGLELTIWDALALIVVLAGIIPIFTFTLILAAFKRYIFSHYKSVITSFQHVLGLYLLSLACSSFFLILELIAKLAFSTNYYIIFRITAHFPESHHGHILLFTAANLFILQTASFIGLLLLAELRIAYKQFNSQHGLHHFVKRNKRVVWTVTGICLLYFVLFIYTEYNFHMFSRQTFPVAINTLKMSHYFLFPNMGVLYIYSLIGTNGI